MKLKKGDCPDDFALKKNTDELYIDFKDLLYWCYADPDNCFPDGLLAPGQYGPDEPGNPYGPYYPKNSGTVTFDAVENEPCVSKALTAHSIVVS